MADHLGVNSFPSLCLSNRPKTRKQVSFGTRAFPYSLIMLYIADVNVRILQAVRACLAEIRSMQLWVTETGEHTKTSRRRDMPRS